MNLCFVSSGFEIGGVERMVNFVGENLGAQEDIDVYYYSMSHTRIMWNFKNIDHVFIAKSSSLFSILVRKIYRRIDLSFRHEYNVNIFQHQFIRDIDQLIIKFGIDTLVLTSGYQFAAIPEIKKKYPNVRIIAWIHESYKTINTITQEFHDYFVAGIREADELVCLTENSVQYFSKWNTHISLIHNAIDLGNNGQVSSLTSKVVSYTSRITFYLGSKGLDLLTNIAQKLPSDVDIEVAGVGSSQDETEFRNMIISKQIADKVNFVGLLQGKELLSHYLNSSLFISTSRTEAFSLVILEAMSVGLPIVAFSTSGSRELLSEGKYGILVDQLDVESFTKKITSLLNDRALLKYYQKLSLERSHDFDAKKVMKQWVDLLIAD
ncbi:glycosyltransferase [Oenococcus oeni]